MLPHLPFEANGLVHRTDPYGFTAICGTANLSLQIRSTDQVTLYREVARVQHRVTTCVACLAGWNPETT